MDVSIKVPKTIGGLKKRASFLRVQNGGQKWVTKSFILQKKAVEADQESSCDTDIRFGLTVTKKTLKRATDRNRVKRRLRVVAREILPQAGQDHMDYVLIGRRETLTRQYTDLQKDLKWALRKLSEL